MFLVKTDTRHVLVLGHLLLCFSLVSKAHERGAVGDEKLTYINQTPSASSLPPKLGFNVPGILNFNLIIVFSQSLYGMNSPYMEIVN